MKLWNLVSGGFFLAATLVLGPKALAQSAESVAAMKHLASSNVAAAVQTADDSCERGDMQSCALSGMLYYDPKFGKNDLKFARLQYEKGCNGGYGDACAIFAQMQYGGVGGEINKQSAYRVARKACNAGNSKSCATAKHIEPEVKVALEKPNPQSSAVKEYDWRRYRPLLDKFSDDITSACTVPDRATTATLSAIMTKCKATSKKVADFAFNADKTLPKEDKAIYHFFAAIGKTENSQMVQKFIAKGYLPKDQMFISCTGYDLAEYFIGSSSLLKDTEFSARYTTLEARIASGQALCK